jgi:hypothetical protein
MAIESSELSPFCSVALQPSPFRANQPKVLIVRGNSFVIITRPLEGKN